jgi:ketosteroid isomerase-like protein
MPGKARSEVRAPERGWVHWALTVAVILSGWVMSARAEDALEARNEAAVEAGFQAWMDGTGSPYDLLSEDATWTIVGRSLASKRYPTKEAFLREVIRPFNARMRERLKPSIRNLYSDGDTVIVFFDAKGTALDGKPYVNTYSWFLKMSGGKIIAAWAFFDSLEFNELWSRVRPPAAADAGSI